MRNNLRRTITFVLALIMVLSMIPVGLVDAAALKRGSKGTEVKYLQQNLIGLGYLEGEADGSFGSKTEAAVRAFQQEYGLQPDGSAGYATQTAVNNAIVRLQVELKKLGCAPGTADGHFGTKTKNALKEYQRARGLEATGVADAKTWAKINSESGGMRAGATVPKGSSGTQVRYLQQALIGLGYLADTADGKYGSLTTEAVRKYQSAYGLSEDGSAGPDTMTSLRNSVSTLQSDLSRKGWYTSAIDGVYGNGTRSAVKSYQKYVGLSIDGIAGPATMKKLYGYSLGGNDGGDSREYRTYITPLYQTGDKSQIWYNKSTNTWKTVESSGCAGVSMAMVLNALLKTDVYTGKSVMDWFVKKGYYYGKGTDHKALTVYPEVLGLNTLECNSSSELVANLKKNRLAIILCKDYTGDEMFTHSKSDGHYVVVAGYRVVNGVQQIYVNNPLKDRHNGWCELQDLMDNAKPRSFVIIYN